jgi:hypothetical protein
MARMTWWHSSTTAWALSASSKPPLVARAVVARRLADAESVGEALAEPVVGFRGAEHDSVDRLAHRAVEPD